MIHDDQAKNPEKESNFKSWPTNRDLGKRLKQITARWKRINTSKILKKDKEMSLTLWVLKGSRSKCD